MFHRKYHTTLHRANSRVTRPQDAGKSRIIMRSRMDL